MKKKTKHFLLIVKISNGCVQFGLHLWFVFSLFHYIYLYCEVLSFCLINKVNKWMYKVLLLLQNILHKRDTDSVVNTKVLILYYFGGRQLFVKDCIEWFLSLSDCTYIWTIVSVQKSIKYIFRTLNI